MHDVNMSEYESPIQLIIHEIQEHREKEMWTQMYKVLESYEIKVDKGELIKALSYDRNQYEKGYENGYKDGKLDAMNYIEDATTIDAQPVKHGQWSECWRDPVRNVISVICSACGDASIAYLPRRDLTVDDVPKKICIQMPYCPKCSAKMEGDSDADS